MTEEKILYLNENCESRNNYLHIYGVRLVDNLLNVCVYSDCGILEMYMDGRLCNRKKDIGVFDFYEPLTKNGTLEIKVCSTKNPEISQVVNIEIT
jgi:hypothetical protein